MKMLNNNKIDINTNKIILNNILTDKLENNSFNNGSYVAIGTFDGLHTGHRALVRSLIDCANIEDRHIQKVVFTFASHPLSLVAAHRKPQEILTQSEKLTKISELDIDIIVNQEFTQEFASLSCEEFVKLLKNNLNVKGIFVGFNFTFGKNACGNPHVLQEICDKYEIILHVLPDVEIDGVHVSSTAIRKYLVDGEIDKANKFLGYNFTMSGQVVKGKRVARTLGFPTANVVIAPKITPKYGVYGVNVRIPNDDNLYLGIANIGYNPTLKDNEISFEVHIFQYTGSLYDETISVEFVEYIRPQVKFDDISELKKTINNNIIYWKEKNKNRA